MSEQEDRRERIPILGHNCSFPRKVHALLQYAQGKDLQNVACWTADGKGFVILNPIQFMEKIATHFFPNHSSFRSFERMLNIWGFKRERAPPPQKFFWNSNFQRERPELCRHMERTENKGTKKRVSVSGIKRCVHVKKNLPSWAQEHQHAALMFLSAQSTEIKKSPKVATRHRSDEQNGETLQLESKEYLQGWARAQDAHTEQKPSLQNQMPSSVVASPTLHQCGSGVESDVKKQSSGSNKMAFKEFEGTRNPSFFDEKDVYDTGFGTLFQSGDSPFQKKASLGGQFDDAPDSLLVLANAAVSDHSSKHPCNNLKEKDVFEGKLKNT